MILEGKLKERSTIVADYDVKAAAMTFRMKG